MLLLLLLLLPPIVLLLSLRVLILLLLLLLLSSSVTAALLVERSARVRIAQHAKAVTEQFERLLRASSVITVWMDLEAQCLVRLFYHSGRRIRKQLEHGIMVARRF